MERQLSQSKAALSSMLRARHPSAQFLGGPPQGQGGQGPPPQGPMGGPAGPTAAPPYAPTMDMLQKQRHQMMMRQQQMRPQGMPPVRSLSYRSLTVVANSAFA